MNSKTKLFFFIYIFIANISFGQTNKQVKDYLRVAGPVTLNKTAYNLVWTSHPSATYYKQEYIPKGEVVEKFKHMVLLEVLTGQSNIKDIVNAKVAELKNMKAVNPMVNYDIFQKNGEYILDFLLSQSTANGKELAIVERNVYRYKVVDVNGQQSILLLGASERSYGKDIDNYLRELKAKKSELTNAIAAFTIPAISVQ